MTSPSHSAYGGSQGNRGSTQSFSSSRGSTPDSKTLETNTKNQRRVSKAKKAPLTRRLSLSIQKGRFYGDVARNDSCPVLLGYRLLEPNESAGVTRDQKEEHSESPLCWLKLISRFKIWPISQWPKKQNRQNHGGSRMYKKLIRCQRAFIKA